jgi:hypothetical protein
MVEWLFRIHTSGRMPRKRNPAGIAAGKLVLAIQHACAEDGDADALVARKVMDRARTLLQAAQIAAVLRLLDGRTIVEYLDAVWVEAHPSVGPHIDALVAAVTAREST